MMAPGFGGSARGVLRRLQHRHAEQRREEHRDEPGHHQRDRRRPRRSRRCTRRPSSRAKPIGTKPAMVTSVPVSIGAAERPVGEGRRLVLVVAGRESPDHRVDRGHRVVDQQRQRDDQRAERDALQVDPRRPCISGKTMASVSGIESATTAPARTPSATKLHDHDDDDRLPQRLSVNSPMALSTVCGLVGDQVAARCRSAGRRVIAAISRSQVLAEREDVAAVAHRDREPDRGLAVDAEHRLRRIGEAAADLGDVASGGPAVAGDEVDRGDVGLDPEGAGDADRQTRSSPVCTTPAGRTRFCACSAATSAP